MNSLGTNEPRYADCARTISAHNYLAHAPKLDAFSDQRTTHGHHRVMSYGEGGFGGLQKQCINQNVRDSEQPIMLHLIS